MSAKQNPVSAEPNPIVESKTKELTADETITDEPTTDETITEESLTEEPITTDESTTGEAEIQNTTVDEREINININNEWEDAATTEQTYELVDATSTVNVVKISPGESRVRRTVKNNFRKG